MNILTTIAGVTVTLFFLWKLLLRLCPWIKSDLKLLKIFLNGQRIIRRYAKRRPIFTIIERLIELASIKPDKNFVLFEEEKWSYKKINDFSNQVGRVLHKAGIRHGDSVALMMTPCPQLLGIWFGIAKTAGITAFINYHHRKKSLLQLIQVSKCKVLVVSNDEEIVEGVNQIKEELYDAGISIYVLGDLPEDAQLKHEPLHELIDKETEEEIPREWRKDVTMQSHFCYIYTSGTTGLPKASILKHARSWLLAYSVCYVGVKEDDVLYTPLPLYHTAGLFGVAGTLQAGCTIIIRRKFSASHFWDDCRKYKATVIQYIGETLRYVCDQPPSDNDMDHCVRAGIGNGLRPVAWKKFINRFGNITLTEFYATTEGNCGFFNLDGKVGSVGLFSPLMKASGMVRLVKYDREKDEIVRDSNGRCVEVPNGTPGVLVAKITIASAFHGYLNNKKQTEQKILRNAFKDGDAYFITGDLLKRDHDYHMYFIDRLGDTFRWHGENVSTNEVADIMTTAPSIRETNVYGVEIPGSEGKAGMMVAILQDEMDFDNEGVYRHACECLATYARPKFIRIKKEIQVTGTFKHIKTRLTEEGFDLKLMKEDAVYFLDNEQKSYVPLTQKIVDQIHSGAIRL